MTTDPTPPAAAPQCSGKVVGGREHDWRDIPCPHPATTTYDGKPVCEDHREHAEARERERIAETFTAGVPLERLRAIVEAGGLAKLIVALNIATEAMESAHYALKYGAGLLPSGYNERHAMLQPNEIDETGTTASEYREVGERLDAARCEAKDKVRAAIEAAEPFRPKGD